MNETFYKYIFKLLIQFLKNHELTIYDLMKYEKQAHQYWLNDDAFPEDEENNITKIVKFLVLTRNCFFFDLFDWDETDNKTYEEWRDISHEWEYIWGNDKKIKVYYEKSTV